MTKLKFVIWKESGKWYTTSFGKISGNFVDDDLVLPLISKWLEDGKSVSVYYQYDNDWSPYKLYKS